MPSPNYELLAAPATWDDDVLCGLDTTTTIQVTVSPLQVFEVGGIPLVFTFELSAPLGFATTINYTMSGTATNGADYIGSAVTGTRTIAPGDLTTGVAIYPVPDYTLEEPPETVIVTIDSAICNGVPLEKTTESAIGEIADNPYRYVRWVGNLNRAVFDNNPATPYFADTGTFTSDWFELQTSFGVQQNPTVRTKDIVAMRNTAPVVSGVPYLLPADPVVPWRASGIFTLNPAVYPYNLQFLLAKVQRYNPNNSSRDALLSPNVGSVAYSVHPPGSSILEFDDRVATYTGVFQFSNDASTVLATWEGL